MSLISASNQLTRSKGVGLDQFLTFEANRSFFTSEYNKVANHAKVTLAHQFVENVDFAKTLTVEFNPNADFLSAIQIYFRLPALSVPPGSTFIGWTQTVAYAMIETVELRIGDTTIVEQPGYFLEVMDYLQTPPEKNVAHWKSVGRHDTIMVTPGNASEEQDVIVPLNLWFTGKLSQGIPLFTLNGWKVKILVTLRRFQDLVTYDGNEAPLPAPSIVSAQVLADYYMITNEERDARYVSLDGMNGKRMLAPMSYLIDQWQVLDFFVPAETASTKCTLSFSGHVKELVFFCIETESQVQNDHFMFGQRDATKQGLELISAVSLHVDGQTRCEKLPESYYRIVTPQRYHSYAGNRNIYVLPFSETPETCRPSSTLDFTSYDTVEMLLDFVPNVPQCTVYVLGIVVNRLTFFDDTVQLEFL